VDKSREVTPEDEEAMLLALQHVTEYAASASSSMLEIYGDWLWRYTGISQRWNVCTSNL